MGGGWPERALKGGLENVGEGGQGEKQTHKHAHLAAVQGEAGVARLEQVGEQLVALLLRVHEYQHAAFFVPHAQQLQQPHELVRLLVHLAHEKRYECNGSSKEWWCEAAGARKANTTVPTQRRHTHAYTRPGGETDTVVRTTGQKRYLDDLRDVLVDRAALAHDDLQRQPQHSLGQFLDLLREGGGKQDGLAVWTNVGEDHVDLRGKTHIEAAVSLVQNDLGIGPTRGEEGARYGQSR